MKASLSVGGIDDLDDRLAAAADLAEADQARAIGIDALEPIADGARQLVRRRSGRLARSIGTGLRLSPAQAYEPDAGTVEVYVGPGSLPQAITEEFGTIHEAGHAYLRPAWDGGVGGVLARIRTAFGDRLIRAFRE